MKSFIARKKNIVGIVAEYNPFHNGHIYQINWIKQNIPNAYIVVGMTNKYTQRGEFPIASFRQRAKIAKKYGVNKVIKLDDKKSIQAAHIFASNAVKQLAKHKIKYLVFGSETNDIDLFYKIATTIKDNIDEYNKKIKFYLKQKGTGFPRAASQALSDLIGVSITLPNDILGIEYVKEIVNSNLDIKAISIQRTIPFHSDETMSNFASASKIRSMIKNNEDVSTFTPMRLVYKSKNDIASTYKKFKKIVNKKTPQQLASIKMIDEGMENLFKKQVNLNDDYYSFIDACVSKRYTGSRIKRAYLSILLNIKKD
ncbi:nucleotidyltransferase [Mycoplasma sp. 2248]|uniref:nucleotidyltransferase n=1 Tax=Mycoplasma sp. 2248 TaxID=3108528 RepID=UPI002B1D550B|nr:nucleotidyltransferase [Mycoplasma sp. 2248]MEA4191071.1 nucleotidyltransferase [Mycoplasma sp. 2248]